MGIVAEMQATRASPEQRRQQFALSHPEFADRYPGLFFKASEDGMDMTMLKFMVGNIANSDGEKEVGKELYDKFVSPAFRGRFMEK